MPEPTSLPVQDTGNVATVSSTGSAVTALVGGVTSMVFNHVGVRIGALASNTTFAWLVICVPVLRVPMGFTLNCTLPWPSTPFTSGGRKPTVGSLGGSPVVGSMEVKVHLSNPVSELRLPCMRTDKLELILKVDRKSTRLKS